MIHFEMDIGWMTSVRHHDGSPLQTVPSRPTEPANSRGAGLISGSLSRGASDHFVMVTFCSGSDLSLVGHTF
jgi:hypothetical protein